MAKKPLIGLIPQYDWQDQRTWMHPGYLGGIEAAGGLGVTLPLAQKEEDICQLAYEFDGYLFTGGPDIHPRLFGQQTLECCGNICAERDRMELLLLEELLKGEKPVLGICRGIQGMAVGMGGSLYQDIPQQMTRTLPLQHDQKARHHIPVHSVTIEEQSLLRRITGKRELMVNSLHHQAVKEAGERLRIVAVSPDGVIEAVEHPDKPFFLGVQWHPERMWQCDEDALAIFNAFVAACAK